MLSIIPALIPMIMMALTVQTTPERANHDDEHRPPEQVVVTGTRTERLLSEVPVRTEVLDRELLTAAAARSLADAIEFTPGVRVLNSCQNCNFTTLSMLGLEGMYSQVLFDSRPMFNSLSMVYGLEQIPAEMMERIEVIKGGGSAMYGPGAVGGVINIIPRQPVVSGTQAQHTVEDQDGVRNWNSSFNAGVVSGEGHSTLNLFGHVQKQNAYDRNGDGFSDVARRDLTTFGGRLTHKLRNGALFVLDYGRVFEDRRGGDNLDAPPFEAEIAEWIRTTRDNISANAKYPVGQGVDLNLSVSYANTDRNSYYGGGGDLDAYGTTENPLLVLDAQMNHFLRGHIVSWGLQYTADELVDDHPGLERNLRTRSIDRGLFVQDDWTFQKHLTLLYGVRLDDHNLLEDPVISPRAALQYKPNQATNVRASFSTGFLAPQIFNEDLHVAVSGGEPLTIVNGDGLRRESSRSFTLGAESTPRFGPGSGPRQSPSSANFNFEDMEKVKSQRKRVTLVRKLAVFPLPCCHVDSPQPRIRPKNWKDPGVPRIPRPPSPERLFRLWSHHSGGFTSWRQLRVAPPAVDHRLSGDGRSGRPFPAGDDPGRSPAQIAYHRSGGVGIHRLCGGR